MVHIQHIAALTAYGLTGAFQLTSCVRMAFHTSLSVWVRTSSQKGNRPVSSCRGRGPAGGRGSQTR